MRPCFGRSSARAAIRSWWSNLSADLATLSDLSVADLSPVVHELIDAGIVVESDDRLAFEHDLVRDAIRSSVPAAVRRELDRRGADVLFARGAMPDNARAAALLDAERGGCRRSRLRESDLLCEQRGIPECRDNDELVAGPLGGLSELDIECLARPLDDGPIGEGHVTGEGSGDVGDHCDPVFTSELDRVGVAVHVHVGERGHHRAMASECALLP